MIKARIYFVDVLSDPAFPVQRLVRANSAAQALRHVAGKMIFADVATQDVLVSLISKGVRVEDATDQQQPLPHRPRS
jgi:hypothetical protein